MKVGIGTYSFGGIASYLGLGPTLLEKFKTIKELGFTEVELLPVDLDNDVEDIKKWLDETGLEVVSIHAQPTEEIVKKMAALGGKAVIWAGSPFCNKAEAIELAHQLDEMAEMAAPYGIKVGYHNHSQEFFVD
jgi:sugar phosphate isomerase/epimerase